jgi:hypothetical protein
MTPKYFYAALPFAVGVAFVAALVTLPVWFAAFGGSAKNDEALFRALQFIGTPVAMAAVGFWWGAAIVELRERTPLALFLVGVLCSTLLVPIVFLLLFLLDDSGPWFSAALPIGGVAAVGSFLSAFVFNGVGKPGNAS